MKILLIIGCILLAPLATLAQYMSANGHFRVDEIRGCAPLTVTFTNLEAGECTGASPCDVKFEVTNTTTGCVAAFTASPAATVQNPAVPHTFAQPGIYRLIVLYQGFCDEITITVTPSTPPAFDITTCGNNEVKVTVTDVNYDSYFINFNDGTEVQVPKGPSAVATHVYGSAGLKSVSVRGKDMNADDNCAINTKNVTALAALTAPFINQLTVANNGTDIDLAFTGSANVLYRLDIATNSTNFQQLKTVHDVNTITVNNLRTDDNYYCFRLGAYDPCNNLLYYSNTICSTNFDATASNNQNNLTWITSTTGISNFTVNRDGNALNTVPASPYTDAAVSCNVTYTYQLISNYANGSTSLSSQKTVTAIATTPPTATDNVTAVVTTSGADLTWQQDPAFTAVQYTVQRKSASSGYSFFQNTTTPQVSDPEYKTPAGYCYTIGYQDACDNTSLPGIDVCPIRLDSRVQFNDNSIVLNWTAYSGWVNGVNHYIVERYDEQGQLLGSTNVGTATTYTEPSDPDHQVLVFVVKAEANDTGLGQAISNEERTVKEPNIFYPRAFTPDGQGPAQNEIFSVYGQFVVAFEMKIFNRWGELMFTTENITEGWDGNVKGKAMPEGTYAFIANITDTTGKRYTRSGSVLLLRKK